MQPSDHLQNNHFGNVLGPDEQLREEFEAIFGQTEEIFQPDMALCLSGGGIRSATFSLGVLQGLARAGKLERFDYLSTVSGGGYVGSWLSRWCVEQDQSQASGLAPLSVALSQGIPGGSSPAQRLRSFSNYLSPTWGFSLDSLTVFTIFLHNLLFNLLVWIPFLAAVALMPRLVVLGVNATNFMPLGFDTEPANRAISTAAFALPLLMAAIWWILAMAVLATAPFSHDDNKEGLEIWREAMARWAARFLYVGIAWLLFFFVFVYLPLLLLETGILEHYFASSSVAGGLLVVATSLVGFWSHYRDEIRKTADDVRQALGHRVLDVVAGLALLVITTAMVLAEHAGLVSIQHALWGQSCPTAGQWWTPASFTTIMVPCKLVTATAMSTAEGMIFVTLSAMAVIFSWFVGVNQFSLHALYGNRLVRAYLGSARNQRIGALTDFDAQDNVGMSQLPFGPDSPGGPNAPGQTPEPRPRLFHLINMTLNLTGRRAADLNWQERKSAAFIATPLHCGASTVGYVHSRDFGKGGMTLGRAMTISGAAVSPNMGYHSSRLVTLIMTLFNVRLGWWVPNPRQIGADSPTEPTLGLGLSLREAFSGTDEQSDWLNLSDGGHFDNLGLYEMIRRRCHCIVVVDATCDGKFEYAGLFSAVRLASIDFSVPVELPLVLPGHGPQASRMRVIHGRIRYSASDPKLTDGDLYVLKPILTGAEPPELLAYAEASRELGNTFPHHSTVDQFYDETRFESYRRLGEFSATDLIAAFTSAVPQFVAVSSLTPSGGEPTPPPAVRSGVDTLKAMAGQWNGRKLVTGVAATLAAAGAVTGAATYTGQKAAAWLGNHLQAPAATGSAPATTPSTQVSSGVDVHKSSDSTETNQKVIDRLDQLHADLQKLISDGQGGGGVGSTSEFAAIDHDLQVIVESLKSRSLPGTAKIDPKDLALITNGLSRINRTILERQPVDLSKIQGELHDLSVRLGALAPRQNLRGQ